MNLLEHAVQAWRTTLDMTVQDAYKWLFHAVLGGEHAIHDTVGPSQWLEREWRTLSTPDPSEPPYVPLRPDGSLVRLNLRPFKARGGNPERLLDAFVNSARVFRGDKTELIGWWQSWGWQLEEASLGSLNYGDWESLNLQLMRLEYPPVHHSALYERVHRPAYRVLLRTSLAALEPPDPPE